MPENRKPVYRCPHCLSIKVSSQDLGNKCPSCFKQIQSDLKPSYYEADRTFGRLKQLRLRPEKKNRLIKPVLAGIVAIATVTAYLDSSRNSDSSADHIADTLAPLGALFHKRISFEDISDCFIMLEYLQQEGWNMYQYNPFTKNWEVLGSVTNVSTRSELATSLTTRFQKVFSAQDINPSDIGIDCSVHQDDTFEHKAISLHPKSIRYSDFVKDLEDGKIATVYISADRGTALATYKDSQSFIVNLAKDPNLLHILETSGSTFEVEPYKDPVSRCREANAKRIGLFFSGNKEEFNSVKNHMLYLSKLSPWMDKFSQDQNPKTCSFNLPSRYLSKGVSSNSFYGFLAKVSKMTDGSIEFSSSL